MDTTRTGVPLPRKLAGELIARSPTTCKTYNISITFTRL